MDNSIKIKVIHVVFGMLCLSIILLLQMHAIPYFDTLLKRSDGIIYDSLIKWKPHKKEQSTRVVVIDIDDKSIKEEGRWPWPRDKFVTLLTNLKNAGVVVTAFDIVFSEAEPNFALVLKKKIQRFPFEKKEIDQKLIPLLDKIAPTIDNDQKFADALQHNEVVLGYLFHHEEQIKKGLLPPPLLNENNKAMDAANLSLTTFQGYNGTLALFSKAAPHGGFVSAVPDIDGVIRHGLLLANFDNKAYASLALSTIMHYLLTDKVKLIGRYIDGKQVLSGLNVAGIFIPTNAQGQILIPFWGPPNTMDSYSASDIVNNKISAQALSGSIAIIGSSMVLASDLHQTPISQSFPGVEIMANMVSGILSQQILTEHDWNTRLGLIEIALLGLSYTILLIFLGPFLLLIFYMLTFITVLATCFVFFTEYNIFIAPTAILLLITLQTLFNFSYYFILERQQKNKLRQLFGQYIPPSHIKEITDASEQHSMRGETRDMSVFFSDIRGFTTLSESLDANEVKRLLNAFFTPVTDIIFKHQGTIDKYVGDMVMAFWGAPIKDENHAYHAIAAALDIKTHLSEINSTLNNMQLPMLKIGMGLSSGLMNVGDMGSNFRRSYTVLGDTVNLASRLEALTKFYQVDILVNDKTRENQDAFIWCPIDKVAVKGRIKPLTIYSPLGYSFDVSDEMKAQIQTYEQALVLYYQQDWAEAKNLFEKLKQTGKINYLYQLYLLRIEEFCRNPPPKDWDGTFIHLHK